MKKLLAYTLIVALLLSTLTGCSQGDSSSSNASPPAQTSSTETEAEPEPEMTALSPENTSLKTEDGVTVDVGPYVLEEKTELTVNKLEKEADPEVGWQMEAYEISLGDLTQLDDYITLRLPYDPSFFDEGQDESKCIGAKYFNEETGKWEDALFEVDVEANELVVYTDHLSKFAAFYIRNVGMRYAYISSSFAFLSEVDTQKAINALKEYVDLGGVEGQEQVDLAEELIYGSYSVISTSTEPLSAVTNAINIASLGAPVFDTSFAQDGFKVVGNYGKVAAAIKIWYTMTKREGRTDAEIYGIFKDVASLALSFSKSAALGVTLSGLYIFDLVITEMFSQGMAIKMENIGMVYKYFNDEFVIGSPYPYKARSLKDWRQVMIEIVEKHPDPEQAKKALDEEIDRYARAFWEASPEMQAECADELNVNIKRMNYPTSQEIEPLVADYKKNLYERLHPVGASVQNYFEKKAQAQLEAALQEVKEYYNQPLSLAVIEELQEGTPSLFAGYTARFGPLAPTANKDAWTIPLTDSANFKMGFSLLGFLLAGSPSQLQFFKPGDDPDTATPEKTFSFTLNKPATELKVFAAPSFDDICGTYSDGMLVLQEIFVSDSLKAEIESGTSQFSEQAEEYGCDSADIMAAMQEQIGMTEMVSFTISATGENKGTMLLEDTTVDVVYDPGTGVLTMPYSSDEDVGVRGVYTFTGGNGEPVKMKGDMILTSGYSESDFHLNFLFTGTKDESM